LEKERDDVVSQKATAKVGTTMVEKEKTQLQAKLEEEQKTNEAEKWKGKGELVAKQ